MFVALSYPFIVPTMFRPSLVMTETDSASVAGGGGLGRVGGVEMVLAECAWRDVLCGEKGALHRHWRHREAGREADTHYNHTPAFHASLAPPTSVSRYADMAGPRLGAPSVVICYFIK